MAGEARSRVVRHAKHYDLTHYLDLRQQRLDTACTEYANQSHFVLRMCCNIK